MPRQKNHSNPAFAQKIRAILYDGAEDKVTPCEFVLYLLETHKENGAYHPITRDAFSLKVKGRDHYFTEIASKETPGDTLPLPLAATLANLTHTEPFFWLATSYSLAQAKDIHIDMKVELPPTSVVTTVAKKGKAAHKPEPEPDSPSQPR